MAATNGAVPIEAKQLQVNGLRYHVLDAGQGTPVILLHGFPDTSELWRRQIDALVRAGFRVIAPDLRGRGKTERPPNVADYALPLIVQDVAALLTALGIQRAHVVGHDWGAAVAWLFAAFLPDRVDHLVAISVGYPGAASRPKLEDLQKGWYRLLLQFEGIAEELIQQDGWYLFRELLHGGGDEELYIASLSEPGALTAGFNWYRANLPPERLLSAPELPPVKAPTLGIWSTGDLYLTERGMLASAAKVTGPWKYVRIEDASHWIPLDKPDLLNQLLLEFLSS
ncbi:MAG TPA: alpha/beta hydrolase [Chloroflexota bacterium]|nr:alpha/beta hydrolase [Chloroflexota bacterium]